MKARAFLNVGSLALAALLLTAGVATPAEAACSGSGTVTIRAGKTYASGKQEYWFFQGGRVCDRRVY